MRIDCLKPNHLQKSDEDFEYVISNSIQGSRKKWIIRAVETKNWSKFHTFAKLKIEHETTIVQIFLLIKDHNYTFRIFKVKNLLFVLVKLAQFFASFSQYAKQQ